MEPGIFARFSNLGRLLQSPYTIEAIEPFDLFPNTYHVETLAILRRKP